MAQHPETIIRPEQPHDSAAIRAVHIAAFPGPDEADLVDRLRRNGNLHPTLVSLDDNAIVGHIAFSPVSMAGTTLTGLGLAPLAVLPAHQRRGIGGQLIHAGLDACLAAEADYVVVLGDPAYYGRFGFTPAYRMGIANEYTRGDAFQILELRAGSLEEATGLVRYGDEFRA